MLTKALKMMVALMAMAFLPAAQRKEDEIRKLSSDLLALLDGPEGKTLDPAQAGDMKATVDQIRKDLDAQLAETRRLQKIGLSRDFSTRKITVIGGRDRRDMHRSGIVFGDPKVAEAFGAWVLYRLALVNPKAAHELHPHTRGMGEEIDRAFIAQKAAAMAALENSFGKNAPVPGAANGMTKAGEFDPGITGWGQELIANIFMADLIAYIEQVGTAFNQCDRVPLTTIGETLWPRLTAELNVATPLAVSAQIPNNAMQFNMVTLRPVKWGTLVALPNEFYRNPTMLYALGQKMGFWIGRAIAKAWDLAIINGDGSAAYGNIMGIFNDPSVGVVTPAAATTVGAYTASDVGNVIAGITVDFVTDPRWCFHLSVERTLRNIRTTIGSPAVSYVQAPLYERGNNGEPDTIDNYPFTICQQMPKVATVAAATKWGWFGELTISHYWGMLDGITVDSSEQARFEADQTVIRGVAYADAATKEPRAVVVAQTHA